MDFGYRTPQGRAVLVASMARSLLRDDELRSLVHEAGASRVYLWWGDPVPIKTGDTVYYFPTSLGIALEAVVSP